MPIASAGICPVLRTVKLQNEVKHNKETENRGNDHDKDDNDGTKPAAAQTRNKQNHRGSLARRMTTLIAGTRSLVPIGGLRAPAVAFVCPLLYPGID